MTPSSQAGKAPAETDGTLGQIGEFGLIRRVATGRSQPAATIVGPGDDAAMVAAPDGRVVASTDVLVETVHFRLDWSTPEQVGRRAAAANLADIAAMGAVPTALLVGLACPANTPVATLTALADGLWAEAGDVGAGVVGGDVASSAQLMVVRDGPRARSRGGRPSCRGGARPGDLVAVRGRLGWAAAGLAVLQRGFRSPAVVVNAHRVPEPPYAAGPEAAKAGATAMIDVSDGLLADLGHVARASGVRIDVRSATLDVPARLADVGAALGADPRHWLLTGGDDHALAATFPRRRPAAVRLGPRGHGAGGRRRRARPVLVDGRPYDGGPGGWDHFAAEPGPQEPARPVQVAQQRHLRPVVDHLPVDVQHERGHRVLGERPLRRPAGPRERRRRRDRGRPPSSVRTRRPAAPAPRRPCRRTRSSRSPPAARRSATPPARPARRRSRAPAATRSWGPVADPARGTRTRR